MTWHACWAGHCLCPYNIQSCYTSCASHSPSEALPAPLPNGTHLRQSCQRWGGHMAVAGPTGPHCLQLHVQTWWQWGWCPSHWANTGVLSPPAGFPIQLSSTQLHTYQQTNQNFRLSFVCFAHFKIRKYRSWIVKVPSIHQQILFTLVLVHQKNIYSRNNVAWRD